MTTDYDKPTNRMIKTRFCQYRHMFGRPREGVHAIRVLDVAVVDALGAAAMAYLLQRFVMPNQHYVCALFITLAAGFVLHTLFCVRAHTSLRIK